MEWQLTMTSKTASSPPWSRKHSLKFPPTLLTVPDVSENNSCANINKGKKLSMKKNKVAVGDKCKPIVIGKYVCVCKVATIVKGLG